MNLTGASSPFSQLSQYVGFTQPLFLLLLPALGLFYWLAHRKRPIPRGPWPLALWLRTAAALLVVLAMSGLRLPAPPRSVATVFVVDLSSSIPADIQEASKTWVRQAMQARSADDLAGIVTFGATPRVELPLSKDRDHLQWGDPPDGTATDVGAALRLAADLLPPPGAGPVRRIVLLTDGNETAGDAQSDLLRPRLKDVEVSSVALPQRLQDAGITSFSVPPALREGEGVELRVALLSPVAQDGQLKVWAYGGQFQRLVYDQPITLEAGPREVVMNLDSLPQGSWSFKAELSVPTDSRPENNTSWAYTIVGEPARVLLVEGADSPALQAALTAARMKVDVAAPDALPTTPDQLEPYQAVVLNNLSNDDLGAAREEALRQYVADWGRGLVAIGGDRTFGLGDYANTPLETALPVTVQPPDRDQAATLALVLVIDRSGSMSATDTGDRRTSRMDLAKEGAIQAAQTLQEGDQVGIIAFDYDARWISDIKPMRGPADSRQLADRISTIQPDGGTDIYRAMEMGYRGLQQVQARVKHMIVLTDGEQGSPAPFPQLVQAMRRSGITVSTLGIASTGSAAATLQNIARIGQGRFYVSTNASDVPRIMTQEARLAGRSYKQERDFKPRLATAAPAVRGLVPADFPDLHGYVRVSPKPSAETVLTSDQEEAVLSQWQYGLGRAVAWTADAEGDWSRDWAGSDQYNRLWAQTVRWAMPAASDPGLQAQVRQVGSEAYVRLESTELTGEFRNQLNTSVDIAQPDGTSKRITLPQTAPGRYEGHFSVANPGVYFLNITQTDDAGKQVATSTTGYAVPHLAEYQLLATNHVLLERLAAVTGGPEVVRPTQAWRRDTETRHDLQDVWPQLMMAALIVFVADVAVRRIRPSMLDLRDAQRSARERLSGLRPPQVRLPEIRLHPLQGGRQR